MVNLSSKFKDWNKNNKHAPLTMFEMDHQCQKVDQVTNFKIDEFTPIWSIKIHSVARKDIKW